MVERPHIDRSTYKYIDQLSRAGFAWEFLRRNSDYRRDWQVHRTSVPRRHVSWQGIEFSFLRRRFTQAESWGLRAFEDPTADGRSARLFWLPNVLARSIQGRALLDQTEGGGSGRRLPVLERFLWMLTASFMSRSTAIFQMLVCPYRICDNRLEPLPWFSKFRPLML
jgi:hypothetical protein